MKYNSKYGRWFTKGGLVYRYDSKQDKLILCKMCDKNGYKTFQVYKKNPFKVHRAVYETFVGPIPDGYEIDHINTVRDDNRIDNLRAVTPKENHNNPLTLQHYSESHKGKKLAEGHKKKISESHKGNMYALTSVFGKKYFEHFGYSRMENSKQYNTEYMWFQRHGKCRWEQL